MTSTWERVNALMDETLDKQKEEMDMEKIEPFDENENKFGKNGLWLFIGPQGSGKTHKLISILLFAEMHFEKPFFDNILFCSTSDELDKTLDCFRKKIKTPIEYVPEGKLFDRLKLHIKRKKKFYSMMKFIKSGGKTVDKTLKALSKKHKLYTQQKTGKYIKRKVEQYGHPAYPSNLCLIMDDFLGSDLLESKGSPMVKFLTKCRHYNITCIIAQQSTKGIGRTVRRLTSDCALWKGFGEDDFMDLCREFSMSIDRKQLYKIYRDFNSKHDCMCFHNHMDEVDVEIH